MDKQHKKEQGSSIANCMMTMNKEMEEMHKEQMANHTKGMKMPK